MTLLEGNPSERYEVLGIHAQDEELERFLFSLGCYPGETVTLVSKSKDSMVLAIRDGRYTVDAMLGNVIEVKGH